MKTHKPPYANNDIAIIGMAGVFPGAENIAKFWHNLINGIESIKLFTKEELLATNLLQSDLVNDLNYIPAKGYLDKATLFAANFFGLAEKKAKIIDPQYRVFLECVWLAFEDAGYNLKNLNKTVGVYATSSTEDSYYLRNLLTNKDFLKGADTYELLISNAKDFMATLVAYYLDLKGPCINIQTACSSSLVAICQACDDLLAGKCDMAIAGGMSISFPLKQGYLYKPGMIYSSDGHCRAFSVNATGIVRGNGGGAVLLKPLAQAEQDNDYIYAIIKGYAINNDGRNKLSYTAPGLEGQYEVLNSAIKKADIDPATIQYIETHGSGTRLGDQIEVTALKRFLSSGIAKREYPCLIGSVKSNIGHLDVASGIASFIKTTLAIDNGIIPKTLHCENPNPEFITENLITVVSEKALWPSSNNGERYAGVSSFGVGGTNAHAILTSSKKNKIKKSLVTLLTDRKEYYIPPAYFPVLPKPIPNNKNNQQSYSDQPLLHTLSWVLSNAAPTTNEFAKAFVITQDSLGYCNEIFDYFINESASISACIMPLAQISQTMIDETWLMQRTDIWSNFLKKYSGHATITIIHLGFAQHHINNMQAILATHFYDFIALAKAISQTKLTNSIRLLVITNGLAKIKDEDSLIPMAHTLLGVLYGLPTEYPFLETRAIDIGNKINRSELLNCIQKELTLLDHEKLVAYRDGTRFILTAQKLEQQDPHPSPIALRNNGVYLITGGLGGIGLTLAEYLAKQYQAKLILISKNKFPAEEQWENLATAPNLSPKTARQLSKLIEIKKSASGLLIFSADVADADAMQTAVTRAVSTFGNIHGVIHAASAYPEGLIKNKSLSDIEAMFNSKIKGLKSLETLFKQRPLDFMILCTALNTYEGSAGAVDYIAANAFLDAYAQSSSTQQHYPVIAISWDAWKETGMRQDVLQKQPLVLEEIHWQRLLKEHCINNKMVVPGSMLIEILIATKPLPVCLEDLAFTNMAVFDSINNATLTLLTKGEEIKIQQITPVGAKLICQTIISNNIKKKSTAKLDNLTKLKKTENISLTNFSKHSEISLGSHWQCLEWVKQEGQAWLAYIVLPQPFSAEITDYVLHPAMLDIAYSFFTTFFKDQYVPFYIKKFSVYAKLPKMFYSIAHIKQHSIDAGSCICQVTLFDEQENILVEIEEFCLRPRSIYLKNKDEIEQLV